MITGSFITKKKEFALGDGVRFIIFGNKRRLECGRCPYFCINMFNISLVLQLKLFCG